VGLLKILPGREAAQTVGGLNRPDDRFLKHLLSHYSHLHEAGLDLPQGKREDDVPVVEGMHRGHDPGQGVLAQLGQLPGLGLIETGVGQDHAQGGVLDHELFGLDALLHGGPGVGKGQGMGTGTGPGHDLPIRINHVAEGVDHYQSGDRQPVFQGGGGISQSALGGLEEAEEFSDGGPGPGSETPFLLAHSMGKSL